nr:MAG TPA: hypothetical protein [Bacteriophage sp.]
MPYENMSDTEFSFRFDDCKTEFASDTEYYEYLEDLKKLENTCK